MRQSSRVFACLLMIATTGLALVRPVVGSDSAWAGRASYFGSLDQVDKTESGSGSSTGILASSCPPCRQPCDSYEPGTAADSSAADFAPPGQQSLLGGTQYAALGGNTMSVNDGGGYLDIPIVATWFRARYDTFVNNPDPYVAEFLYAKPGNFGGRGPTSPTGFTPTSVNGQVGSFYGEVLVAPRLSVFGELRIVRTDIFWPSGPLGGAELIQNGGLGDTYAGLKYAMYVDECQYLTFQFKTYAPSGDAGRALGTGHVSLEPSLLYLAQFSDRAYLQGQLSYWVPVGGSNFAGNVISYGLGLGYDLFRSYEGRSPLNPYIAPGGTRVTAWLETQGWTVLSGKNAQGGVLETPDIIQDAAGFSVLNVKPGLRFTHNLGSVYAGFGIAVTGDQFYSDLFRIEYRRMF